MNYYHMMELADWRSYKTENSVIVEMKVSTGSSVRGDWKIQKQCAGLDQELPQSFSSIYRMKYSDSNTFFARESSTGVIDNNTIENGVDKEMAFDDNYSTFASNSLILDLNYRRNDFFVNLNRPSYIEFVRLYARSDGHSLENYEGVVVRCLKDSGTFTECTPANDYTMLSIQDSDFQMHYTCSDTCETIQIHHSSTDSSTAHLAVAEFELFGRCEGYSIDTQMCGKAETSEIPECKVVLVRQSVGKFHESTDKLRGTSEYGSVGPDNNFSLYFENWEFDTFIFATKDHQYFMAMTKAAIGGYLVTPRDFYSDVPRAYHSFSPGSTEWEQGVEKMYYRSNNDYKDPWLGTRDHDDTVR